jgi:hypothetical protein
MDFAPLTKNQEETHMINKQTVDIPERFKDHPVFNTQHCGMNFGFMAKRGYYNRKDVRAYPAKMAKAGVNWTTLNANFCQEQFCSTKVFLDFAFSSGELELSDMAKALRDAGIKILFKPCLTLLDGAWMGWARFPAGHQQIQGVTLSYWDKWFASFTESAKCFADLAERMGLEGFIIGAEYYGTEGEGDQWRKVIETVRNIYSGPITYEFTSGSHKAYSLDWLKDLDFLSYSYYPPACPPNGTPLDARNNPHYTVESMVDYLRPQADAVVALCERLGNKPIAFTEIGCRSAHGVIMEPGDYLMETYYDGEEQAHYMEAVFRTFWDLPQWMGMYWWKWDETQNRPQYHRDPKGDMGFTIEGKPAEKVLKDWYSKIVS